MRRTISGEFHVEDRGGGLWRLTNHGAPATTIFLQGVAASSTADTTGPTDTTAATGAVPVGCDSVTLEWRPDGSVLVVMEGTPRLAVRARAAFLHEPRESLYAALPLATFTDEARRFWRRVFRIVRLPGGRLLVGWLARRARTAG